MSGKYILDKHGEPKQSNSLMQWANWYETGKRSLAREIIGDSEVSTAFLSIDHSFGDGPPVLWETMVFGGKLDQQQDRCGGKQAQAKTMHARMVKRVKAESP